MQPPLSSFRSNPLSLLLLFSALAALVGLYFPILAGLTQDWATNDNYSHGYFIPFISGYMIYSMKGELQKLPLSAVNWGLFFLLAGLAQLYVASVGSEFFLQRTSLIPVLLGMSLFLWGLPITRKLLLPIFYLLFMVPLPAIIWNKIAFPLQLFSSAITEEVVRFVGIPIFREGNVLHLAQTTLEVVDACSGLRSLTTMFALAAALAWFTNYAQWKKWALFLLAAPVAIFANIVRLTVTAALASIYGEKVAQGFLHDFSGLFTFVFGLMLLILLNKLLYGKH
ncbi:exosortase/archaeosortase family protein [Desulfobulbus propionicus]